MVATQVSQREAVAGTMVHVAGFNHNVVLMGSNQGDALAVVDANLYPKIIKIYHSIVIVAIQVQHQWCLELHKIKI